MTNKLGLCFFFFVFNVQEAPSPPLYFIGDKMQERIVPATRRLSEIKSNRTGLTKEGETSSEINRKWRAPSSWQRLFLQLHHYFPVFRSCR